jgi:hypothetical protein
MPGVGVKLQRIHLHIDELVLEGHSAASARRISDALQAELGRLLAEPSLPSVLQRNGTVERIDAGEFRQPSVTTATALGASLAQALYAGLKR